MYFVCVLRFYVDQNPLSVLTHFLLFLFASFSLPDSPSPARSVRSSGMKDIPDEILEPIQSGMSECCPRLVHLLSILTHRADHPNRNKNKTPAVKQNVGMLLLLALARVRNRGKETQPFALFMTCLARAYNLVCFLLFEG